MDKTYRLLTYVFSGVGLLDSVYLTWSKLTQKAVFCGGSSQCETVNSSSYSEFYGIPIAIIGLGAYLVILALTILETRSDFLKRNAPLLVFGMSLAGVIYSAYLTYIEIAVLRAICPYCVVSAIAILLIFILSLLRLLQPQPDTKPLRSIRGG